jgi:hypothetical protein
LNDKSISRLLLDQQSGLWIGTLGDGLTYLTFGQKTALCTQKEVDNATCQTLQANQRAAIIIAGGGAQSENTLWDTTEFISSNLYNVLNKRGFNDDEIYYLTPDDRSQNIEQIPQFYDGTHGELGKHYLNNLSKITGDDTFAIESAISSSRLQVGQEVMLTAKTSSQVKRAWAVIRPPQMKLNLGMVKENRTVP